MHRVLNRRSFRPAAVLACAGLLLQGCYISHPRFGADNFRQEKDTNGVPTYTASGSLPAYEKPEPYVVDVVKQACPDGNPAVVGGQAITTTGQDRYGFPVSGQWWTVTFTCEKAIAGLTPTEE